MDERWHILVAEDEALAALALDDFLSEKGYRVTLAANGAEALAAYQHQRPDALVTDINMPKMNGLDLIRAIRGRDPSLPIIVMTGYRDMLPGGTERLFEDAEGDVMEKPLDLERIHMALQRLAAARG